VTRRDLLSLTACAVGTHFLQPFRLRDDVETFTGRRTFANLLDRAQREGWAALPIGERTGAVALAFVGTPYVGWTLEKYDDREVCSINLDGLDCVTLFESSLNFARLLAQEEKTPEALLALVQETRYRDGKIDDYLSRLHYTSDWMFDNEKKGIVKIVTPDLPGAERFEKPLSFMSEHATVYRQLKANPALLPKVVEMEKAVSGRKLAYLPKGRVAKAEPLLQTGDIIGLTTTMPGMDISHTGLCYRDKDGILRFLHASSTQKKVVLDRRLSACLSGEKTTGIMVARPV